MKIGEDDILIHSLKALKLIRDSKEEKCIDLSKIEKITPFYIAPLTAFLKSNTDFTFELPEDPYKLFYLETIQFPQTISEVPRQKTTYTPLFEIKGELGEGEYNEEILDLLEKIIVENFELVNNKQILMFVINELICNIQQHSESKFNCIQAQMYENKLAISLIDTGITIPGRYKRAGYKESEKNLELFKLAFEGISTKDDKERGTGIQNSYKCICRALKGSIVVISNNCGFKKISTEENIEFIDLDNLNLSFNGTIINLLFEKPTQKLDIYPYLEQSFY
ncbi:MAG: hypothetical protein ACMXYB_03725 [Candidatus Woesearchaeota archaeon]